MLQGGVLGVGLCCQRLSKWLLQREPRPAPWLPTVLQGLALVAKQQRLLYPLLPLAHL
jgi:hypothetical protein